MRATVDAREVALTGYEFALLAAFVDRAGHVLHRDQLIELARHGDRDASERTVDVHVYRLRRKIGRAGVLRTIRGVGYVLVPPDAP